jgi:hypothetical protein
VIAALQYAPHSHDGVMAQEEAPAVWPTWAEEYPEPSSPGDEEAMAWSPAFPVDERDLEAFNDGTPDSGASGSDTDAAASAALAVGAGQQRVPPEVNGGTRVQVARTDGGSHTPEGARAGMRFVATPMARERGPSSDSVPDGLRPARDPAADPAAAAAAPPPPLPLPLPHQPPAVRPTPTGQPRRRPGGAVATYAMPGVNGLPALTWDDVGQLLEGHGPLYTAAIGERPHIMTRFDPPRQLFREPQVVRRKAGCDRWMNSGGKKGSIVHWLRPGFGLRKRYGKCVVKGSPEQQLKYAEFLPVTGTATAPETNKEHAVVFVLERVREENAQSLNSKSSPTSVKRDAAASTPAPAHTHAVGGPTMIETQKVVSSPAIEPLSGGRAPRVFEGSRGTSAAVDIVQDFGSRFVSFQARQDSGKMIELGTIEKGGNGVTLSSTQGDFAEWHRRAPLDPALQEGDVVGFTNKGEITQQCSASGGMMLGVVSRKAIVEGSAPPEPERHMYDTVAYCGVVPVRVVHRSLGTALPAALTACTSQCKGESSAAAQLFVCQLLQCTLLRSLLIMALICMHALRSCGPQVRAWGRRQVTF